MKRLNEIRARLVELKESLAALGDQDELSEADEARFTTELTEWDQLTEESKPLEEREAKLTEVRSTQVEELRQAVVGGRVTSENGDSTRRAPIPGETASTFDLTTIRSLAADPKRNASELRSRALTAIEQTDPHNITLTDEQRANATRLVERDAKGGIAKHILLTGSPEYQRAFEKVIEDPQTGAQFWEPEERQAMQSVRELRAALSLTSANGGYLVPFLLDPTIILTNNGATNPMRLLADVRTVDVNVWHGVSSAGVTAEWIAEATEVADASPTFAQPTITCFKADAYVQASWEVIADSGISSELSMLIADAKDRLEATAFVTGSGVGQPNGVVNAASGSAYRVAGSSGAAGAADFVVGDVYATQNALPPRYRANASWLAEQTTYNKIRQFATGTGPQHAFWADLGMNIPAQLLGRPTYEASAMDNTIVSGSNDDILLLGDFRHGYKIIDRIGLTLMFEPLVLGSNRRPTGESAWVAYWRTGGDAVDVNSFRLLRV